jgi:energy-coupling factor transport system substrate-specific component
MIALVAALAALAVAGRLVFAPIPNVVATTDIVLITGYAVGAAPGFAVGALAAVVSNLWLGEGPWTPWQMAGWGMVGVGGAALAAASGRSLGRVGLALACGLAGLAYGALLDLSVMVTYGGEQSLDRYLALSSRGVPFNVAHAAGNIALALAAGPALVRMISRYRTRFEFSWREVGAAPLALLLAMAMLLPAAEAAQASGGAARTWLERAQNGDGGFGPDPGSPSSAAITGWAVLGLEAAGRNPLDLERRRNTPIDYLRSRVQDLDSTGDLERTILALEGAGVSPRRFGGHDLVAELRRRRSRGGTFQGQVNLTAFGILALRAAGTPTSQLARSAAWLRDAQNGDDGWGFQPDAGSDADSTGAALQGLAAAGARGTAASRGQAYLRRVQRGDGGYSLAASGGSNAQSTAWAVQGLVAAGANPGAVESRGRSPLDYLAARQASDGHYRYSSSSDQTPVWVTGQALLAVNRKAFPLSAVPRSAAGGLPVPTGGASAGAGGRSNRPESRTGHRGDAKRSGRHRGDGGDHTPSAHSDARARLTSGDPASAPAAPNPSGEGSDERTTLLVAGGFTLLTAGLVAGFFWYRRRLP